mmetsp:Transcript_16901/g.30225  ORF Transcript_16901/g.30225 Transcript_16901/m.30225 type:complete len:742 (-) Transcript_16901:562-2787(-)
MAQSPPKYSASTKAELHLPKIGAGFHVSTPTSSAEERSESGSTSVPLMMEVLESQEKASRQDVLANEELQGIRLAKVMHQGPAPHIPAPPGKSPKTSTVSYKAQYQFLKSEEFWEVVWQMQKDEEMLAKILHTEEDEAWSQLMADCGGLQMNIAACTIQRGWRCHAARDSFRKKTIERNAEEAIYNPAIASSTIQFHYPRSGQPAYEVPTLMHTNHDLPTEEHDGPETSIATTMHRIKTTIARFMPDQNAQLYEYTRHVFPQAIEVDPTTNVATISLYALDPGQLQEFKAEAMNIYYRSSLSVTSGAPAPPGSVPNDEASLVKREVLAKRIADLTPENQKTLIMHLRRLAPHCIKVQEGVGMVDTADLDDWHYSQANVIVLELLQLQRDQNINIREAYEAERLRIAKEREELELQRERQEADELQRRRDIMDAAWLQEQQIRDYEERQLLLRMRQQEELERKKLAIEQEKRVHEERLKWEQAAYEKEEAYRQQEREAKFKLRQQLNELERLRADQQRQMDIQQREYQRRLRQLELREKEMEFDRAMKQEEENAQLELFRASLAKELDLLSEEQLEELSVYVKEVAPYCLKEARVVPDLCTSAALSCVMMFAVQLRLGRSGDQMVLPPPPPKPRHVPAPPRDKPSSSHGSRADMQSAAAPLAIKDHQPLADESGIQQLTMEVRLALSEIIGKLNKAQQRKLVDHLQKNHPSALFTMDGRVGVDTANLDGEEFWIVRSYVHTL